GGGPCRDRRGTGRELKLPVPRPDGAARRFVRAGARQGISAGSPAVTPSMTDPSVASSRRPVRQGLYGGLVSSKRPGAQAPPAAADAKPKKPLKLRTVLDDALDLVRARKGRLLLGLGLM